jgi:hypothetical protein
MAYPTSISPAVQHYIDNVAIDRSARTELAALFASDDTFDDLSVWTRQLKVLNVTIHGSLNNRSDLDRLRERIGSECNVVRHCPVHWKVRLRTSAERIEGLDSELFRATNSRENTKEGR